MTASGGRNAFPWDVLIAHLQLVAKSYVNPLSEDIDLK
jgi:hypothetical protein